MPSTLMRDRISGGATGELRHERVERESPNLQGQRERCAYATIASSLGWTFTLVLITVE
jgi:hypothetical protein